MDDTAACMDLQRSRGPSSLGEEGADLIHQLSELRTSGHGDSDKKKANRSQGTRGCHCREVRCLNCHRL